MNCRDKKVDIMRLTKFLLTALIGVLASGCSVFNYFMIEQGETVPPQPETGVIPGTDQAPPELYFMQGDVAFPMDRGSYCWTITEFGICADAMPPSYEPEQHVLVIGPTLELLFEEPLPNTINVNLHPGSNLMTRIADIPAEATMAENGRILVALPEGISGDHVLVVFATWNQTNSVTGDASYTTPIRLE